MARRKRSLEAYKRKNKNPYPPETVEQIKFVQWLTLKGIRFSASANGGKRNIIEAVKLKRMGISPGFPDIEIPLPRGKYHGLYIELKREKGGVLSKFQVEWINYLNEQGYLAVRANGCFEAMDVVDSYLRGDQFLNKSGV